MDDKVWHSGDFGQMKLNKKPKDNEGSFRAILRKQIDARQKMLKDQHKNKKRIPKSKSWLFDQLLRKKWQRWCNQNILVFGLMKRLMCLEWNSFLLCVRYVAEFSFNICAHFFTKVSQQGIIKTNIDK